MGLWNDVVETFFAALWFSWLGLLIAALPSVGLGLYLKGKGSRRQGLSFERASK
jgi:hypothetical protein